MQVSSSWFPRSFSLFSRSSIFVSNIRFCSNDNNKQSIAPLLRQIRNKTGAGVMECKRALESNNMNVDDAIKELLKKARSSTGRGRTTSAGWLGFAQTDTKAIICELQSETDFVSKNKQFQNLANNIASAALQIPISSDKEEVFDISSEDILKFPSYEQEDVTISQKISELIFSMGETMKLDRCEGLQVKENGIVNGYIHGGRLGVLVSLSGGNPSSDLARDIAIHIVACNPKYISKDQIPEGTNVNNSDILLEQDYIHDETKTVKEILSEYGSPKLVMHAMRR